MGDLMFFFGVVLGMGYSWQVAMLAVFLDGEMFSALSFTSFPRFFIGKYALI